MKIIKKLVDRIGEELNDAQHYAECALEETAEGHTTWGHKFHTMAEDELNHAMTMHTYAVEKIEHLKSVYIPSDDMLEKWERAHKEYVSKAAWIKQMLSL